MELMEEFSSPLVLLSALPWVLLFAWVSRRLVGARHLSVKMALGTGVVGYAAGLILAFTISGGIEEPGFVLGGTIFTITFTMVAIVALELMSRRRPASISAMRWRSSRKSTSTGCGRSIPPGAS